MITITDNSKCCGCTACMSVCPKDCIQMVPDKEGFLYPNVYQSRCIDCSACDRVCPMLKDELPKQPLTVYAAINTNEEIRINSSSGGIFTHLAHKIIEKGGVVFGAGFDDNLDVIHQYADNIDTLSKMRGSKYVQSSVGDTFRKVKELLGQDRYVLYSGSPCQIHGLKNYLKKEYEKLLLVDFVCHGVPSPKVWRLYLDELTHGRNIHNKRFSKKGSPRYCIENINFRCKDTGWKNYTFRIDLKSLMPDFKDYSIRQTAAENIYMRAFLSELTLRPSCYKCKSKNGRSGSDITIADFWSIQKVMPSFDDDKGTCLLLLNNEKKREFIDSADIIKVETKLDEAKQDNGGFMENIAPHKKRAEFFENIDTTESIIKLMHRSLRKPLKVRLRKLCGKIYRKIIGI